MAILLALLYYDDYCVRSGEPEGLPRGDVLEAVGCVGEKSGLEMSFGTIRKSAR